MQIIEVLQGDLKPGQIVTTMGDYFIDVETGILTSRQNLTPMNAGDRWIFALGKFESNNAFEYFESLNHRLGMQIAEKGDLYVPMRYNSDEIARFPLPDVEMMQAIEQVAQISRDIAGIKEVPATIDASFLGVYNRDAFNFGVYAQLLDHFQIGVTNWANPGRSLDARLIEMANAAS